MTHTLEVADARRTYGQTIALDGASLELGKGEWLALLGPNGAGKTTLIRSVAGRLRLDSGTLRLLGEDISDPMAKGSRQKLGVVPQNPAIYGKLTARENLSVFAELFGVTRDRLKQRVDRALEWTGLADRADDVSGRFSGGMKRRLNIACGVLHDPAVILLDEPTVGVDPQSRQRIWDMLAELKEQGVSLLLTTHQLDEAQQVSDRITIIDHGKTIATGTFSELIDRSVGAGRRIRIRVGKTPDPTLLHETGFSTIGERTLVTTINNVGTELPPLLPVAESLGESIEDISIDTPTLQDVFLHYTGRELRE